MIPSDVKKLPWAAIVSSMLGLAGIVFGTMATFVSEDRTQLWQQTQHQIELLSQRVVMLEEQNKLCSEEMFEARREILDCLSKKIISYPLSSTN